MAGGKSRRLGRDKLVESFQGRPLIIHVLDRLRHICDELVVVVAEQRDAVALPLPKDVTVASDLFPGKGSLGGIYSGLTKASSPWALVVAGDMPFLNQELISHMLGIVPGHDVVVPLLGGRPEPTHAIYSKQCLGPIHDSLDQNQLKITGFFDKVRVREVDETQILLLDPNLLSFFNVNTQGDLDRAIALAKDHH